MKTHLRQIGNSKGVLLPAAVLAASGIGDDVELSVKPGRIVITPAKRDREGWYDGYQTQYDLDVWCNPATNDADMGEWEW